MNDNKIDISGWFSTYGVITAQRLLEQFKIKLDNNDLLFALKTPGTFYYRLLILPLQNVFNGIILQQARDYQIYSQKLFIDYLLSGEASKLESSPGASTREDLEIERKKLVEMDEEFRQLEFTHEKLIAESQRILIKNANEWHKNILVILANVNNALTNEQIIIPQTTLIDSLTILLIRYDFQNALSDDKEVWQRVEKKLNAPLSTELQHVYNSEIEKLSQIVTQTEDQAKQFHEQTTDMSIMLKQSRKSYKSIIIHVNELFKLLTDFHMDTLQVETNRQDLNFDPELGE